MLLIRHVFALLLICASAFGLSADGPVLGKLGQTKALTKIFASPNSSARVYYRAKAFEYMVVKEQPGKYIKVVMSNGADGFVRASDVAILPYEVRAKSADAGRSGREMGTLASRSAMANYALRFTGTPYKWGGENLQNGIDCSAFVKKMYGGIGMNLPRTAAEQALVGKSIKRLEELQPGDRLYFWEKRRNKIGHTGIYLGNGYFVHSSSGKGGVGTDYLSEKWRKILVAARR